MSARYLQKDRFDNPRYRRCRDNGPKSRNLARVEPVAKNRLVPGTVVYARVPYWEGEGEKTAPAVVVQRSSRTVSVLRITTSDRRHDFGYHEVLDLEEAGLDRPSGVDNRVRDLDLIDVLDVVGSLGEDDRAAVLGRSMLIGRAA